MRSQVIGIYVGGVVVLGIILYFAWAMPSLLSHGPTQPLSQTASSTSSTIPTDLLASGGQPVLPMKNITVGGVPIQAEVASNDAQREAGLSGRKSLPSGQGMLFVFPQPANEGFWMKEMNFPLDILYADASGTIVTIWPNLSPSTYPQAFYPTSPAQYVLELPANFAAQHNIVVGSKIVL
jgi:uncharacterized protein